MQQMHKHGESGEDFNDLNLFPASIGKEDPEGSRLQAEAPSQQG